MIISIVNRSKKITDAVLQCVIRAINRQITEDFEPYWSFGAQLRLEGKIGRNPSKNTLAEMRGDAVIYLWDKVDMEDALGYHAANMRGIPYGFVFTELAEKLGENWTVTLSHEALELVGDPQGNLLVQGPHPELPAVQVFHWFEICDAVQSQSYTIDGVSVANFLLPLYFTFGEQKGARNDFLGASSDGKGLHSFGIAQGGYIGFYDPRTHRHNTYLAPDDKQAQRRLHIKDEVSYGRGYWRKHQQFSENRESGHSKSLKKENAVKASTETLNDPIKHIVVLMLENRSFDHMLGGMSKIDPNVEGVQRNGKPYFNQSLKGKIYEQLPGAAWVLLDRQDPDHEHDGTMRQLGTVANPMSGFIDNFLARYPNASDEELAQVMSYFEFGDVPEKDTLSVLHTLARNFAICDHWFSSLPGPTWQNRFFAHSGTCLGHLLMPSGKEPQNMHLYYQDTIYDRLSDAGIDWKIYHDGVPQSIVMVRMLGHWITKDHYEPMDAFYKAAEGNESDFPEYAFIEPCYFGEEENDQHPPADVRKGEQLIADIYNAIRANDALWKSTLLIVTCDEHGGFYDHVTPPPTVAPDNHTAEWSFDQLGVRVPAILISPWVKREVIKTVFDHTSLLRYICDKWNLPPLGLRMQEAAGEYRANSFHSELVQLSTPREDTPEKLTAANIPQEKVMISRSGEEVSMEPPIEGSREALLMFVEQLPQPVTSRITSEGLPKAAKAIRPVNTLGTVAPSQRVASAIEKLEQMRTPAKE